MAAVLTTLTSVVTSVVSVMGDIVTFIMASGHELILIPFGVILLYSGISALRRIL